MNAKILLNRIDSIIEKGNNLKKCLVFNEPTNYGYVPAGIHNGYKALGLSFISNLLNENHVYYLEFKKATASSWSYDLESSIEILNSLRFEIENGWLDNLKKLVSAELFTDFLDMSKYLLDENYKDASAVIIGATLEEHLRILSKDNGIETNTLKGKKLVPKTANLMNDELYKNNVYDSLKHKSISAWMDLRNKAAHGKYNDYNHQDVDYMFSGVLNFMANN